MELTVPTVVDDDAAVVPCVVVSSANVLEERKTADVNNTNTTHISKSQY